MNNLNISQLIFNRLVINLLHEVNLYCKADQKGTNVFFSKRSQMSMAELGRLWLESQMLESHSSAECHFFIRVILGKYTIYMVRTLHKLGN